jgi:hypothetical protein
MTTIAKEVGRFDEITVVVVSEHVDEALNACHSRFGNRRWFESMV